MAKGIPHRVLLDLSRWALSGGRNGRELLRVDAFHTSREAAGLDVQRVLRLKLEIYALVRRQAGHDVREKSRRNGNSPPGIDLPGHPVGDSDLEVGGSQLEAAILGPEKDIVQNGQRAPGRDGSTYDLESTCQVLLHDRKLHFGFTPLRRARRAKSD